MTMNLDVTVRLIDQLSRPAQAVEKSLKGIMAAAKGMTGTAGKDLTKNLKGLAGAIKDLGDAAPSASATTRVLRMGDAIKSFDATRISASAYAVDKFSNSLNKFTPALTTQITGAALAVRSLSSALSSMPSGVGFLANANAQTKELIRLQGTALANQNSLARGGGGYGPDLSGMQRRIGGRGPLTIEHDPLTRLSGPGGYAGGGGSRYAGPTGGGSSGSGGSSGGGPGRGRRGMGGGGGGNTSSGFAYGSGMHGVGGIARHAMEASMTAEDVITVARMQGNNEDQINKIKALAQKVANENKSTTYAGNLKGILEARLAVGGSLDEAMKIYQEGSKYATVMGFMSHSPDRAKAAQDMIYDALRTGELRNIINTKGVNGQPGQLDNMMQGMMASSIVSENRIDPKMWHANVKYARSAGLSLDDHFANFTMPFLMQELSNAGKGGVGGQAGNALMSSYAAVVQSKMTAGSVKEWNKLGYADSADIDKKTGRLAPGKLKDSDQFMHNPLEFMQGLLKAMDDKGIKGQTAILKELSTLFGNRTALGLQDLMALQGSRIGNFDQMLGKVYGVDQQLTLINNTLSQSTEQLNNAYGDLLTTLTGPFVPALTGAAQNLNSLAKGAQGVVARFTGVGSDPNDPNSTGVNPIAVGLTMASAGYLGLQIVRAFPSAATLMGQAFVGVVTGSPIAAFMSKGVVEGIVRGISTQETAMSRFLMAVAAPEVGVALAAAFIASLAGSYIPKGIASLADLGSSKADLDKETTAHQDRLAKSNAQMLDPATSPFAKRQLQKQIYSDQKYLDDRNSPYVAGARAGGGSVSGGKRYLVGEHGPELFSSGASGGITSNSMLNKLASGDAASGPVIATAIRSMSLDQSRGLSEIARALINSSRDSAGSSGGGGSDSGGGGGGGSGGGGGGDGGGGSGGHRHGHGGGVGGGDSPDAGNVTPDSASGGAPNKRLAAGRAKFFAELDKNPSLRRDVMKTVSMENGKSAASTTSVLESMVNRAQMNHYSSLNQAIHSGFYGPVNRGGLRGGLSALSRKYGEQAIANVRAGSNQIGYRTDQGMLTDPGARKYMKQADKSGWQKHEGENFFWMGNAGRKWAKQQQDADKAVAQNPPVLAAKAAAAHAAHAAKSSAHSHGNTTHVASVQIHVHPQKEHDAKKIAEHVHAAFNNAVRTQLSDGAYA